MTTKVKNIVLIFGFLITLWVCYNFAISKTISLKKEHSALKKKKLALSKLPEKTLLLNKKNTYYDSILSKYNLKNTSSIQGSLLKTITSFAKQNNIKVINFEKPHSFTKNDLIIYTYNIKIEGNYNNLIQLIHKLESDAKFGEIINVQFIKKKNYRKGTFYLQAELLIQNFV